MFEELAGVRDLGVDVVVARLGADANLLQPLFADLRRLVPLLQVVEAHIAIVEDLADRRALIGGHLHQVQAGLARPLQSLRCRHNAQWSPSAPTRRIGVMRICSFFRGPVSGGSWRSKYRIGGLPTKADGGAKVEGRVPDFTAPRGCSRSSGFLYPPPV